MAAPIIYPANAGKTGLLGPEAMHVVIVYDLLEIAREGVARLMNSRTPDDISAGVVMGDRSSLSDGVHLCAEEFCLDCEPATRRTTPKTRH
jgi:hypothetical protein